MDKYLLDICIPTFNRADLLRECLDSIVCQFGNNYIFQKVKIIVSDNASEDNTTEIVREYRKKFSNILYFRNNRNIGAKANFEKLASLAQAEYLWIFSDDDLQTSNSLETIIQFIKQYHSDVIICNVEGFSNTSLIRYRNLLKITEDKIITNRSEFFKYLSTKLGKNSIDYYTTLCSNWIIKTYIYKTHKCIHNKFNSALDLFPIPSLVFYSNKDYFIGIISKQIILNRGDNELWAHKNPIKKISFVYRLWSDYYGKIIIFNQNFLPKYFKIRIKLKNLLLFKKVIKIYLNSIQIRKP